MTALRTLMVMSVAALVAGGCVTSNLETKESVELVGTAWLAEAIGGDTVAVGVADGATSTLGFVEPGQVAGRGGCNRYFGDVTIDGQSIKFGKLGSTMMACPPPAMEQEKRFMEALGAARRFALKDGTLTLFGDGADPLIRFTQLQSAPE